MVMRFAAHPESDVIASEDMHFTVSQLKNARSRL
jgi:hypothetical protein